jgi:hydroxymethylpyrimidine pyrophosphatase-like HAD family hydrolase
MVIAVDFDGTLCEHKFPEIGQIKEIHQKVINFIRTSKSKGAEIILWTCREDLKERKYLTEAVNWCKENNIPIDFVNEYPMPQFNGFASRKVCADMYIDDKAVNILNFA